MKSFTKETYEKLLPSRSKLTFKYETPKILKFKHHIINDLSLRPIISSIGTTTNNNNNSLGKFLSSILEPVVSITHCTKDSFSFCEEIKKVRANNKILLSYGVCRLFTSIPLTETIDITVDLLFEKKKKKNSFKIFMVDLAFPVCYFR